MTKRTELADVFSDSDRSALLDILAMFCEPLPCESILAEVYPRLAALVCIDALTACTSVAEREYRWLVMGLPDSFFTRYHEIAAHDFVRATVVAHPNCFLRDEQMIERTALEANPMYLRLRELGTPVEHVMAALMHPSAEPGWHGGISLYRHSRKRPFDERDRRLLQFLKRPLEGFLYRAKREADHNRTALLADTLLQEHQCEVVLFEGSREVFRSPGVARLLSHFSTHPASSALPETFTALLRDARDSGGAPAALQLSRDGETLRVTARRLCPPETKVWALLLEVNLDDPPLPASWRRRLTTREWAVATLVCKGWDNQLIASELDCALATVKKHLQRIFEKLGIESRAALIHCAVTQGKAERLSRSAP